MATNTAPSSNSLPANRKRAVTSYAEDDDDLDRMLDVDADPITAHEDNVEDLDMDYGSRKKPLKKRKNMSKQGATTAVAKSKRPGKPFPFLALPPELRDYIYELALTDSNGVMLVPRTKSYRRIVTRGPISGGYNRGGYRYKHLAVDNQESQANQATAVHNGFAPALLAVSKQIHSEAVGYLYKQSIILSDTMALHNFIAAIGSKRPLVTNLTIKEWGHGRGAHKAMNFSALTLLAECTNLQTLTLDCHVLDARTGKYLARQIFRDGFRFFEAFGTAHGRKDAALDILKLSDECIGHHGYVNSIERDQLEADVYAEFRKLLGCNEREL